MISDRLASEWLLLLFCESLQRMSKLPTLCLFIFMFPAKYQDYVEPIKTKMP